MDIFKWHESNKMDRDLFRWRRYIMYQEPAICPLLKENGPILSPKVSGTSHPIPLNLFDRDGSALLGRCQKESWIDQVRTNPQCFTIAMSCRGHDGIERVNYHFFKTAYVREYKVSHVKEYSCQGWSHSLSIEMLYTIKHFQLYNGSELIGNNFEAGLTIHKLHAHLFEEEKLEKARKKNWEETYDLFEKEQSEFEKEKEEWQQEKEALDEEREEEIEEERKEINEEREALKKEKAKLLLAKQKLDQMKADLQRERIEFERKKEKHLLDHVDLDKYFSDNAYFEEWFGKDD